MQIRGPSRITSRYYQQICLAAFFSAAMLPGTAQAQLLSIGGGDGGGLSVGVNLGSTSANVSLGGGSVAGVEANVGDSVSAGVDVGGGSVASVDANVGSSISTSTSVGGSSGLADVNASVGGLDANVTAVGDSTLSATVTSASAAPGASETPETPGLRGTVSASQMPPNGMTVSTAGRSFIDINAIQISQRLRPPSRCSAAGNYDAINGIAVLDTNNAFLGVVVGAFISGTALTHVRVSVDPGAVPGGGCVEYTTEGGRATPQGIVVNTTQARLQAALAR